MAVIWIIIGLVAAGQRGYFSGGEKNCADAGNTILTVVAGPLNYIGLNPKIDCTVPQPSPQPTIAIGPPMADVYCQAQASLLRQNVRPQ